MQHYHGLQAQTYPIFLCVEPGNKATAMLYILHGVYNIGKHAEYIREKIYIEVAITGLGGLHKILAEC